MDNTQKLIPSHRLLSVTEEELARIVLDIHDGPVQYLFAALSILSHIQREITSTSETSDDLVSDIEKTSRIITQALHEMKTFLGAFRPPEFHNRSLEWIVNSVVIQHEDWTSQQVQLHLSPLPQDATLPVKIAVYRIIQEALSNSIRHADIENIDLKVWSRDDLIWIQVRDYGKGFNPPRLHGPSGTEREEHIGLRGMRDRVELIGGRFHLYSQPGEGTHILIKVPAYV